METERTQLQALAGFLRRRCSALAPVVWTIYHMPLPSRKVALAHTRTRSSLSDDTTFAIRYRQELRTNIYSWSADGVSYQSIELRDYLISLHEFSTPTSSGLLSMLLRHLPYDSYEDVEDTRQETLQKEVSAATSVYYPTKLDFSCIFDRSPRSRMKPLAPNIPARPFVASEIHSGLLEARMLISRLPLLIPKLSTKTLLSAPYAGCWSPFLAYNRYEQITTAADVERVYIQSGFQLYGLTEMRSKWTPNNLKPRVYYAQGASSIPFTCLLQPIANILIDCFHFTHRKLRFNLFDLRALTHLMTLFVYDYSSFTSTMHVMRDFCRELASFLKGIEVTVLDGFHGPTVRDVGSLLDDYCQHCNEGLEVDCSQLLDLVEAVIVHNCGALGLPANITLCTLLHGIHLCFILNHLWMGKVIGDDAIGQKEDDELADDELESQLQNLGRCALDKMNFWPEHTFKLELAWNYTKRPVNRMFERIVQKNQVIWPGLEFYGVTCHAHFSPPISRLSRLKKGLAQFLRFHSAVITEPLTDSDKAFIDDMCHWFARYWKLKRSGSIGYVSVGDDGDYLVVPNFQNFLAWSLPATIEVGGLLMMPLKIPNEKASSLGIGCSFTSTSSPVLSYLEKTKFVSKKALMELVDTSTLLSWEVMDHLLGKSVLKYEWVIEEYLPDWAPALLQDYVEVLDDGSRLPVVVDMT